MEFLDLGTLFFLVAAVIIFFQLRNVLGRRTGNERPPRGQLERKAASESDDTLANDNVVALPGRRRKTDGDETYAAIDKMAKPGSAINKGLRAIRDSDESFDPKTFLEGAQMAYEMIVMAFADGDRRTLKNLLSREVFEGFDTAITEREERDEKVQSSFVGINKADIAGAEMKNGEAHVTVRVISEIISATLDKSGEVIDGDPETVAEVKDVWTFSRDTKARDPNWKLVATEAED